MIQNSDVRTAIVSVRGGWEAAAHTAHTPSLSSSCPCSPLAGPGRRGDTVRGSSSACTAEAGDARCPGPGERQPQQRPLQRRSSTRGGVVGGTESWPLRSLGLFLCRRADVPWCVFCPCISLQTILRLFRFRTGTSPLIMAALVASSPDSQRQPGTCMIHATLVATNRNTAN